jgi:hypothetical protein
MSPKLPLAISSYLFVNIVALAALSAAQCPAQATFNVKYVEVGTTAQPPIPAELFPIQSWMALGIDSSGRVYQGWTSNHTVSEGTSSPYTLADTLVLRYTPSTGQVEYLGSFMNTSAAQGNFTFAYGGEEIPKGHTHIVEAGGKVYLGSQGFHDWKESVTQADLDPYRGAHLYSIDETAGQLFDLSAALPGGIVTQHQGIVAMAYSPEYHVLVGLTHPWSDMVLYDLQTGQVKQVQGIPWAYEHVVSREIVVTKTGKVYIHRGPEKPEDAAFSDPVWRYDIATDTISQTSYAMTGGFWNGQAVTKDRNKIYVSGVLGQLYALDVATDTWDYLGYMLPDEEYAAGGRINYNYTLALSPDETKLYWVPSVPSGPSNLYQFDVATRKTSLVQCAVGNNQVFTGSNVADSTGNIYMSSFDAWEGHPRLMVLSPVAESGSCTAPSAPGVNICSPANGSPVSSPLTISAAGTNSNGTYGIDIWLDGVKFGWYGGTTTVSVSATAAIGQHRLDVYAVGVDGDLQLQTSLFTVNSTGNCSAPASPGVNICSPANATSAVSPVRILAGGRDAAPTAGMDVWIDGTKFGWYGGATTVDVTAPLGVGTHELDVYAVGTNGELQKATSVFAVSGATCPAPSLPAVNICAPMNNARVGSPLVISAAGRDNSATAGLDVWLDGVKVGWYTGNTVATQVPSVAGGLHQLDIYAVGSDGELQHSTVVFSVK